MTRSGDPANDRKPHMGSGASGHGAGTLAPPALLCATRVPISSASNRDLRTVGTGRGTLAAWRRPTKTSRPSRTESSFRKWSVSEKVSGGTETAPSTISAGIIHSSGGFCLSQRIRCRRCPHGPSSCEAAFAIASRSTTSSPRPLGSATSTSSDCRQRRLEVSPLAETAANPIAWHRAALSSSTSPTTRSSIPKASSS